MNQSHQYGSRIERSADFGQPSDQNQSMAGRKVGFNSNLSLSYGVDPNDNNASVMKSAKSRRGSKKRRKQADMSDASHLLSPESNINEDQQHDSPSRQQPRVQYEPEFQYISSSFMKYAIDGNKHDFAERQKNMLAHR